MSPDAYATFLRLQYRAAERMSKSYLFEYRKAAMVMLKEHCPRQCPADPALPTPTGEAQMSPVARPAPVG